MLQTFCPLPLSVLPKRAHLNSNSALSLLLEKVLFKFKQCSFKQFLSCLKVSIQIQTVLFQAIFVLPESALFEFEQHSFMQFLSFHSSFDLIIITVLTFLTENLASFLVDYTSAETLGTLLSEPIYTMSGI
jgi:hypothetical protein